MSVHAPIQVRRVTSSFTATQNDYMILVDTSSGAITGTLYKVTKGGQRELFIIQTGSNSNLITLRDAAGNSITSFSGQDSAVSLQLDDRGTWRAFGKASGVKVYRALLTQLGTATAPTAIVLENSLGGTVVWTRTSTGLYAATLAGAFTANKTWFNHEVWQQMDLDGNSTTIFQLQRSSANAMVLTAVTSFASDTPVELGANINIEILVYP